MKKKVRKRKARAIANAPQDKMGHAVAAFLALNGWDAFVVGPCEVRVQRGYVVTTEGDQRTGDLSGNTLGQYEFIAKFYRKRQDVDPCSANLKEKR